MNLAAAAARLSLNFGQSIAQAFSKDSMNSLIIITRPNSGSYDQVNREYNVPTSPVIYDEMDPDGNYTGMGAPAGITPAAGPITYSVGDEPTYYESLTANIPVDCPIQPRIDDMVLVVASPDRDLATRMFRVTDVPAGGRINPSTTLSCVGIAPSRQWEL